MMNNMFYSIGSTFNLGISYRKADILIIIVFNKNHDFENHIV